MTAAGRGAAIGAPPPPGEAASVGEGLYRGGDCCSEGGGVYRGSGGLQWWERRLPGREGGLLLRGGDRYRIGRVRRCCGGG